MQRKFRIYLGIALVTFLLAILYYDKFYHNRSLGNITRHEKSISSNFYHEEFTLQADLELINVRDKSRTTLKQVCEDQVKLVFRYFATNCEECIFNTIAALYDYYKDDFYLDVALINDSYIKTYFHDSSSVNEYYVKNLDNKIDKENIPYFFIIKPDSMMHCKAIFVYNEDNFELTRNNLKSILNKK